MHQVTVVNPADIFRTAKLHRVPAHDLLALFDGAIHVGSQRSAVLFGSILKYRKHLSIILLNRILELTKAFLHALIPVPVSIVMRGKVMVNAACKSILLGGATSKKQNKRKK